MVSTGLTRARRSQAALALDLIPASKVQPVPHEIAELDKHNLSRPRATSRKAGAHTGTSGMHFIGFTALE
jgi:hypothetical protein